MRGIFFTPKETQQNSNNMASSGAVKLNSSLRFCILKTPVQFIFPGEVKGFTSYILKGVVEREFFFCF